MTRPIALGSAIHGGYDLANAINPPAAPNADLPNPIDPRGLLTFGVSGIGLFVIAWLIGRTAGLPKGLSYLGYGLAILSVVLYLGRLIVHSPHNPLIFVPALLAGFVVYPAWYVWTGLVLWRGSSGNSWAEARETIAQLISIPATAAFQLSSAVHGRSDLSLAGEGLVDRAAFRHLGQPLHLLSGQIALKPNPDLNDVDLRVRIALAIFAVAGVDPRAAQADPDAFQRPLLTSGIHLNRHDFARAQGAQEQFIWVRPRVVTYPEGLVRHKLMAAGGDLDLDVG